MAQMPISKKGLVKYKIRFNFLQLNLDNVKNKFVKGNFLTTSTCIFSVKYFKAACMVRFDIKFGARL